MIIIYSLGINIILVWLVVKLNIYFEWKLELETREDKTTEDVVKEIN